MPLTRFPNGLTVNSTTAQVYNTAATDSIGAVDCLNLFVAGTTSMGLVSINTLTVTSLTATNITMSTVTSNKFIGERVYIPITFTSAATTTYYASPISGSIIDCWVLCSTTPIVCSAFTLYANGTAGSVSVASVALSYATAIGQQVQPALTAQTQGVATGFAVVVTTAGTAATFQGVVVIQRTA